MSISPLYKGFLLHRFYSLDLQYLVRENVVIEMAQEIIMTRINVLHPTELTRQHLIGEYREITRVFTLARKAKARGVNKYNFEQKMKPPADYTLGAGHVKFLMPRLGFVLKRYHALADEMRSRGYTANMIPDEELIEGLGSFWLQDYTPTENAIKINRERIEQRLKGE